MQRAILWYPNVLRWAILRSLKKGLQEAEEAKHAVETLEDEFRAAAQLGKDKFKEQPHAAFLSISDSVCDLDAGQEKFIHAEKQSGVKCYSVLIGSETLDCAPPAGELLAKYRGRAINSFSMLISVRPYIPGLNGGTGLS